MGTEISPAAFHGNVPELFNLACLPPEVRIQVYEEIVNAGRTTFPMPANLKPYAALILSCKQVKAEFEHEWAKAFSRVTCSVLEMWPHWQTNLRALPVSRFGDIKEVRILYTGTPPAPTNSPLPMQAVRNVVQKLVGHFSTVAFRSDKSYPLVNGRTTLSTYFNSMQFRTMMELYTELQWVIPGSNAHLGYDLWRLEVHCVHVRPASHGSPSHGQIERSISLDPFLTHDLLYRVVDHITETCTTMDDLKEYRGLFVSNKHFRDVFLVEMLGKFAHLL